MKYAILPYVLVVSLFAVSSGYSTEQIIDRGLDHATMEYTVAITNQNGKILTQKKRYTTLATGMHVQQGNGSFVAANPAIEPVEDGAAALNTRHQVTFSAHITATNGAIRLTTPDGKMLRSRPLCISYFDRASGQSVLIAEIKDSVGEIITNENKVIYRDCFTDFKCDLVYENKLAGFEQNLLFRERPPGPSEFGLSEQFTELQLLTEFFDPPAPSSIAMPRADGAIDTRLDFGAMKMTKGKAFSIGDQQSTNLFHASVTKTWQKFENRDFLIESVKYNSIKTHLLLLAVPVALNGVGGHVKHVAANKRFLPKQVVAVSAKRRMRVASVVGADNAFVLDYTLLTGNQTNYVFKSDTTYLVTNTFETYGTTIIEGGTVIKRKNNGEVRINENVLCTTGPYRSAAITTWQDDSVGDPIPGSTNNPQRTLGAGLILVNSGYNADLKFLRIAYANTGMDLDNYGLTSTLTDCQFVNCSYALWLEYVDSVWLRNCLLYNCDWGVSGGGTTVYGEHVTVNKIGLLWGIPDGGTMAFRMTNSLLVGVTNIGVVDYNPTNSNFVWLTNDPGVFQTVGAGGHYLAENSAFRDAGISNISAETLAAIRTKTTYPPITFSNTTISVSMTLAPRAQKDTDTPDLGYHYVALDYGLGNITGSVCTISVTNGAALGFFYRDFNFGTFMLESNCVLRSHGSPTNQNHLTWYNTVQEGATTNWDGVDRLEMLSNGNYNGSGGVTIDCSFTEFTAMAGTGAHIGVGDVGIWGGIALRHCSFLNAKVNCFSAGDFGSLSAGVLNCLFERTPFASFNPGPGGLSLTAYNNLFVSAEVSCDDADPSTGLGSFIFTDNFFYKSDAVVQPGINIRATNNAYITNYSTLTSPGGTDLVLTNFTFTNGPLGSYYQLSTDLINAGSRTADLAGLYHFTTQTNLVKETNSTVDIGFHYVATDANGTPLDYDGDGVPDYLEDANGDGSASSGETDWQSATDLGLEVWITEPKPTSNLP